MRRTVIARRFISGSPERIATDLRSHTREILQAACGGDPQPPAGDGSFLIPGTLPTPWRDGPPNASLSPMQIRVRTGEVDARGDWMRIPVSLEAASVRIVFPQFEGGIEMEVHDRGRCEVVVFGTYVPPLGPVGALLDSLALHEVVQHTVTRMCNGIVRALADRMAMVDGASGNGTVDLTAHPMMVADIMSPDVVSIEEGASLRTAANRMLLLGISGMPVVDQRGRVVGVLSERDLLDKVAAEPTGLGREAMNAASHHESETAGEACTKPAKTTSADATVRDAAREMAAHDVDRLVVLDGAQITGIITRTDALKALIRPDGDIAEAIGQVVDQTTHGRVHIDVSEGHVTLRGQIPRRSELLTVLEDAKQVDGLINIDAADLTYEIDDIIPPMPMV